MILLQHSSMQYRCRTWGCDGNLHDFFQLKTVEDILCSLIKASGHFTNVNTGSKSYRLCKILHGYPDDKGQAILKSLVKVMRDGSGVLIEDRILPDPDVSWHDHDEEAENLARKRGF